MKTIICTGVVAILISACATPNGPHTVLNYQPVVDMQGVDLSKFNQDESECFTYASQRANAAQGAVGGAIAGAIIGALLGAAVGNSRTAGQTATIGAVAAGGSGAAASEETQRNIVRRCLIGRGYRVLD